ncbi:MAG: protein kinase [Anaerolineales bacterium]|nr:MAG: protein kinase [Anaerolineales bacterium]
MNGEITFGSFVKERRHYLGLTQAELALQVHCAAITIRKIEANAMNPSLQTIELLAEALAIPKADRLAFVRLARTEVEAPPIPAPQPIPAEIGQQDLAGRAIKGYQLGERIAIGGFGAVYRAVQPLVEREVAIKIILPQYADHPDFIRRFEAEAQLVAHLEHPYIVPLYDYWREPAAAYLVMRLMRGGNLQAKLNNGPLPFEITLRVMQQIGDALHSAHRAGVIHRDIKPANILLDEDGNAYLADFGFAKNLGNPNLAEHTEAGTVIGSLAYISPEQIQAEPVRPQSDIYSLALVFYEMLAGRKAFHGSTPIDFIQQHLNQPVPPLADGLPEAATDPGQYIALDPVIARATAKDPVERYPDVLALLAGIQQSLQLPTATNLYRRLVPDKAGQSPAAGVHQSDLENPFKGLRAFGETDAADFFGRDTLIQALLSRLSESSDPATGSGRELSRFLAVVGPSGSGKSSVVKAGLIPILRQGGLPGSEKWFIVEMMPGSQPLEELEAALLRVAINPPDSLLAQLREDERGLLRAVRRILPAAETGTELVLVIDQFEEVFTQCDDEAVRVHFLDSLVTAILDPRCRLWVIITLRADFIDRPLQYIDFGELVQRRTEFVLPLTPDELEAAITRPAERVGLNLEPGLAGAIIRDLGDQPGTLPLLQYTLTELFERRVGNALTLGAYQASGGVRGALASRADELYTSLDEAGQAATRQIFPRLITLGEVISDGLPAPDTRRRVLRSELSSLVTGQPPFDDESTPNGQGQVANHQRQMTMDAVIDKFGRHRLLTFDRDPVTRGPTVEVAHEALIREWARLRQWLDADREFLFWQQRLRAGLHQWQTSDYDEGALLRGAPLAEAENWLNRRRSDLNQTEREFIQASLTLRERESAEREAQLRRELETAKKLTETEKRAARRLRWLAVGLAVFLLVAASLTIFAFNQRAEAEANQSEAESNLALSESQRLAAEANTIMQSDGNVELAALLSLRAMHTAYTPQADMALQQASKGDYGRRLFVGHTDDVNGLAFSPDGRLALSGSLDQTAKLWDVQTGQLLHTLSGHTGMIWDVAFSPDGRVALTSSEDGTARLWDVQTGRLLRTLTDDMGDVTEVAFSADGRVVLTGHWKGIVRLWNAETGQEMHVLKDVEGVMGIALSPDDQFVLTANSLTGEVRLWEVKTGQEVRRLTGATAGVNSVAFTPDGRYVLGGDWDGGLRAWDLHQANAEPRLFAGHTNQIREVKVSPDGHYVLSASLDGTVRLWDLQTGAEVRRFVSVTDIHSVAFSPNGETFLLGDGNGAIRLWDIQPPPDPRTFSGHTNTVTAAKFSPDGRTLLTGSTDETARLWDVATGRELHVLMGHTDWVISVAISPDGHYALTSGIADNTARLWDIETGQEMHVFKHPAPVFGVAFSPDDRYILTGGDDKVAHLWNIKTGQEIRTFEQPPNIFSVAFLPNSRYLLTGSGYDGSARLWNTETGQEVRKFPGYAGFVNGLSVSPDGQYILTAAAENSAQLWEVETGRPLNRFSGENGVFSPDGKYILTGGLKTAYLWDRATGRQLRAFGVTNSLWGVAFSPDSQFVLIFGSDKIARLWDIDYQPLIDSVCARVLRDFTDKERAQYGIDDKEPTCPAIK